MEHRHNFEPGEWPFADAVNTRSFTTIRVMAGAPILFVAHNEDDGSWEMLDGGEIAEGELKVVCLGCLFEHDRTVGELADLPLGWEASRTHALTPWSRQESPPMDENDG
jgi:hypothetical protein